MVSAAGVSVATAGVASVVVAGVSSLGTSTGLVSSAIVMSWKFGYLEKMKIKNDKKSSTKD